MEPSSLVRTRWKPPGQWPTRSLKGTTRFARTGAEVGGRKRLRDYRFGRWLAQSHIPSDDFELSRIDLATGKAIPGPGGPWSGFDHRVGWRRNSYRARPEHPTRAGRYGFVPFGTYYSLNAGVTPAMLFKASVPGHTDFVYGSE